jgi:membrane protein required for colicin V production
MNWLDIVILCLAVAGLLKGFSDGMIRQIVAIIAIVFAIMFCSAVAGKISIFLSSTNWFPDKLVNILSISLGFILIVAIVLIIGIVIHRLINFTPLGIFNSLLGGISGLILTLVVISIILNFIEFFDIKASLLSQEVRVESRFYYYIKNIIPGVLTNHIFELNA